MSRAASSAAIRYTLATIRVTPLSIALLQGSNPGQNVGRYSALIQDSTT
jgi:hypothetical protein